MQKIVNSLVFSLLSIALLLSSTQTSFASSSILGSVGNSPVAITIDGSGNIYVASNTFRQVTKITPEGVSTMIGNTAENPKGIVTDVAGNVYITNSGSNNITKITPEGVTSIFATTGSTPYGIAIDEAGNLYTANLGSDNVSKITPGGVSTILGTTGVFPYDLVVDVLGNVYTVNNISNNVTKITPEGVSTILGITGNNPRDIALDANGNIYTSNSGSNNVTKITPEGVSSVFGTTGDRPNSITIDSFGNIYTANGFDNNVTKITPEGVSSVFGTTGDSPQGITIDTEGNIYTMNFNSSDVSKITSTLRDATITSTTYTISTIGGGAETITDVSFGTSKTDFLTNLTKSSIDQTWNSSGINDPVLTNDILVVTAEDGTTVITYTITVDPELNHDATVASNVYTVSISGGANRTITNVPFGTSQSDFLANLTMGNENQSWDTGDMSDPVQTGNTLVVTAEDGTTTITYTITTLSDPGVDIDTCAEFEGINDALSRTYRLAADLNCTGEGNSIMVAGGAPFTGTFDGQNHTITIAISALGYNENVGLFRQASSATISNLSIVGVVHGGSFYVGALVGNGTNLNINNVVNLANVSGGSYVGGLVGYLSGENIIIDNASSSGNISGSVEYVGGLVGYLDVEEGNATVDNSHSSGTIDGGYYIGGLFGRISNSQSITTISESYSTSVVIAYTSSAGGLVGYISDDGNSEVGDTTAVNILNSYHTTGNVSQIGSGESSVGGLIGDVRVDYTASFTLSDSYATGLVSGPTNGGLIGDLSLGNEGENSVTINILRNHFSGTLYSSENYVGGLIGRLSSLSLSSNSLISNIIISNNYTTGTISASNYLGGLLGYGYVQNAGDYGLNLTLNNNYSTSSITSSSGTRSGGLIGDLRLINNAGQPFVFTFNQNYATGNISVNGSYVGGLVGYLYSSDEYDDQISSTLSGDYYSGDITVDLENSSYVGGIIGYAEIIGENQLEISSSYSTSDVAGVGNVGGLLGSAQKVDITGSYATGDVSNSEDYTGGLVGYFGSGTAY